MKKLDVLGEGEFIAEIDTWLHKPPQSVIEVFAWLHVMGYDLSAKDRPANEIGLEARKDYLKVSWHASSKGPYVSIKREPADKERGNVRWDRLQADGYGLKDGVLVDIHQFRQTPPPNRDPRFVYEDGEKTALDFLPKFFRGHDKALGGSTTRPVTGETARVLGLYRVLGGSAINVDLDDPKYADRYKWFLIELTGNLPPTQASARASDKFLVLYDKKRWMRIDDSYRIMQEAKISLSESDRELFDEEVRRFVTEVLEGK
jgi:hypothetical protein